MIKGEKVCVMKGVFFGRELWKTKCVKETKDGCMKYVKERIEEFSSLKLESLD